MRAVAIGMAGWLAACQDATDAPPPVERAGPTVSTSSASRASASTASPPVASSEVDPPPRGRRGLWIWEFGKSAPPAERAAELAAAWGVGRVFIKASNGDGGPGGGTRWRDNARPEHLAPFVERGIEVWLFGYFYGEGVADADGATWGSIEAQIDAIVPSALHPHVRGVVVDAEMEFLGRHADAERLCRGLRARLGGKKLAYTSFGWIEAQPRFPYAAFDEGCGDAFLPQVYWAFGWAGTPDMALERVRREAEARGLRAPMWPVQTNEPNPRLDGLRAFFALAGPDASLFHMHPEGAPQHQVLAAGVF